MPALAALLGLASGVALVLVGVYLPWRWGLFRRSPLRIQEAAHQEVVGEMLGLEPLRPARRPLTSGAVERKARRIGLGANAGRAVHAEATALLEAQALEDGALERMVTTWAS